jgi:hypothetical protein
VRERHKAQRRPREHTQARHDLNDARRWPSGVAASDACIMTVRTRMHTAAAASPACTPIAMSGLMAAKAAALPRSVPANSCVSVLKLWGNTEDTKQAKTAA